MIFFDFPSFLGASPLAECALIGLAQALSKPLRATQLDHSSHPSAFTLFNTTFLILGLLLTRFTTFRVFNSDPVTHEVSTYILKTLPSIRGPAYPDALIITLTTLVVGTMVSGPALILSGIAHLVTNHFAQQPPRHHLPMIPVLLILALAAAVVALWLTFNGQL